MVDETQRREESQGEHPERASGAASGTSERAEAATDETTPAVDEAASAAEAPPAVEPAEPVAAEAGPGPSAEDDSRGDTAAAASTENAESRRDTTPGPTEPEAATPPVAPVASVPTVQPVARRRAPWGAMLMSGLIGGAVVAGAAAYGYVTYLADDGGTNNVIFARIGAVEMAVHDLDARVPAGTASGAGVPAAASLQVSKDIEARLAKAEERLAAISTSGLAPTAAPAATDSAGAQAIATDVAKLSQQLTEAMSAVAQARQQAAAALQTAESKAIDPARFPSKGEVDALSERLAGLQRTIATLQQTVQQRQTETARDDRVVRLAVIAAGLRDAVERGVPFAGELDAAKGLMADPQAIALLAPFAPTGVPTAAALAKELTALAPSLEKSGKVTSAEGYFARLKAHAERLVSLRPVDQGSGDDVPAVTARVEALASKADIAAALAELQKLPEPARAPVEPWIKKAQARETAVAAARRIEAAAVAALANHP